MDDKEEKEGFKSIKSRTEEFLQVFKKGEEFTKEILKENEKLRFKLARLEEEARHMMVSDPGKVRSLEEKVSVLEEENRRLMERFREVEVENKDFAMKYLEVEQENNNLANLYVASYQLHSTLDLDETLKTVLEIIMNLIGASRFAVMLLNEKTSELTAVATEGVSVEEMPVVRPGQGVIGGVAASGESYFAEEAAGQGGEDLTLPMVCIPLKIKEHVIGVIVIYGLLQQKESFNNIDYELFSLLAGQAATAIFSSKLYSLSERKLITMQGLLDLIKEKPSGD